MGCSTTVERQLAEVDDATFPLASARLIGGTFHLSGTVESLGRANYRGLLVRLPIELSVTKVVSYSVEDTSGTGALILGSAESFDGGPNLVGVVPCTVTSRYDGTLPIATARKGQACSLPSMVAVAAAHGRPFKHS